MIFVLGSGRSGTHWLGYILDSHPELHVTIEDPRFFESVTQMALDSTLQASLLPPLLDSYRTEAARVQPLKFADKSHPNIWLAEALADALPASRFVGIQRDVWGTVASMLNHKGVLSWHSRWREFPVPNPFLGITPDNAVDYDEYPTATKCALRWRSHAERLETLQGVLGERLLVLHYHELIGRPDVHLERLRQHLDLTDAFPQPNPLVDSLDKWRSQLSRDQIYAIESVVGYPPPTPSR